MTRNERRRQERIFEKADLSKVRAVIEKEVKDEIASLTLWGKFRHYLGMKLRSERKLEIFDMNVKARKK